MKTKIFFLLILIISVISIYLILKPGEKEKIQVSHDMVIQQVEELGKLQLLQYNIRDVIEYKKMRDWLPNSKTALIVAGEIVSCIDLTQIKKEDVEIIGDSLNIWLPTPEICHFKVDHSRSKVYDIQYGLWESPRLIDEAYREAENQLYQQALDMGIAEESRMAAIKILTPFLNVLGFNKVKINFKISSYQKE